jgi:heptosyltransferase I
VSLAIADLRNPEPAMPHSSGRNNLSRKLIVRLSAMGDVIHTLPAVQILREAFPQAHIGWLIEERWAELLCAPGFTRRGARTAQRPLVDEVHSVDLKAWGKSPFSLSTLQKAATVWNDVRASQYELAIDLQGAIRSALLASYSGANTVYGATQPRESPASLWYTRKVITGGRHVIEQNVSLARAVIEGCSIGPDRNSTEWCVQLPRDPQAEARTETRLAELGIGEFAILNPGAGWGAKRWPADRYGELARGLANRGISSIVNYGPGEQELACAVEQGSGGVAQPLRCSITELIALTRRARLFVGGDTGPLHLAAALRVPVVGIYGPTDPARNGPYGTQSVVLRSAESVTSHARREKADEGMLGLTTAEVLAAAERLIGDAAR